jgi:hypothetical protein
MAWRIVGSSVAGTLHVAAGRGCDDAHGWSAGEHATVVAVADGAGSRPGGAALGAHVAVRSVLERALAPAFVAACAADPSAAGRALVAGLVAELEDEAKRVGLAVRELATTLCAVVLAPSGATVVQVGDGIAVVGRASGAIEAVAVADRFEYANETVFLTSGHALEHVKVFAATADGDPVERVALSTDGLRYKALEDLHAQRPFERFFDDSWAYAARADASSEAIEAFLRDVEDQTGDDKTLVLAVSAFDGDAGEARRLTPAPPLPVGEDASAPAPEPALESGAAPEVEA